MLEFVNSACRASGLLQKGAAVAAHLATPAARRQGVRNAVGRRVVVGHVHSVPELAGGEMRGNRGPPGVGVADLRRSWYHRPQALTEYVGSIHELRK